MKVHCDKCNGIFDIKDFDTTYHKFGSCIIKSQEQHDKLPFKEKYLLDIIFSVVVFFGVIIGTVLLTYDGTPTTQECVSSRIAQHIWLNENNEITYRTPREVCDVTKYGQTYSFSYYLQANYSKPWWSVYPSCEQAVFDSKTYNFICPDGSIAQEISPYH